MTKLLLAAFTPLWLMAQSTYDYRVLATKKTSTMEKELNEAASAGFVFSAAMGGNTATAGSEVVVIMARDTSQKADGNYSYRLLATNRTSTMEKELQQMADEGFEYRGQTIFDSAFGGREVAVIMEKRPKDSSRSQYRLLATQRTSTMEKELRAAGEQGYEALGVTVARTAVGGSEIVTILRKKTAASK